MEIDSEIDSKSFKNMEMDCLKCLFFSRSNTY
jgi:hypothetical protein